MSALKTKKMKLKYSIIILLALLSSSCTKKSVVDDMFTKSIALHNYYQQPSPTETVFVSFDSVVTDSRCPKNVECIWQGVAIAAFSLKINNTTYPFQLATRPFPPYSSDTLIQGYKIEFIDLLPYPGTTGGKITATIRITK